MTGDCCPRWCNLYSLFHAFLLQHVKERFHDAVVARLINVQDLKVRNTFWNIAKEISFLMMIISLAGIAKPFVPRIRKALATNGKYSNSDSKWINKTRKLYEKLKTKTRRSSRMP